VWQAWNFQDILKSKTPFCMTSAGHRALFIRGRRGTFWSFCTLLKRWQALVKMRCGFGGHFEWQAPYFVDLCQKVPKTQVKSRFWHWAMFIFRGTGNGFVLWKSNMCSRKPLVILGLSYRSLCGAVRILRSLAQPSRDFVHQIAIDFFFQPIATKKYQDYYGGILTSHWDLRITPYVRMELETSLTPQASQL